MVKEPAKGAPSPWRPIRQRRRGLYFRVEIYDPVSLCWLDAPGTFGSAEDAQAFVERELGAKRARIMKIDGRKRTIVS